MQTPGRPHLNAEGHYPVNSGDSPAAKSKEREGLIAGLNHDLAGEYQAVLMYTLYSAKLTGPYRLSLRGLFLAEIGEEQGHAQFLADKITALGGEPTTKPRPVPHADGPRAMLAQALAVESLAIATYAERLHQAESFGDIGLKVGLENLIAAEVRHKEEIERILLGWDDLNPERARPQDDWRDDGGEG